MTVAGPDFAIVRSADAPTMVVTAEASFAAFGSGVVEVTTTVLVRLPDCAGAVTATVMVGAVDPVARARRVHVTLMLPTFVQAHLPSPRRT